MAMDANWIKRAWAQRTTTMKKQRVLTASSGRIRPAHARAPSWILFIISYIVCTPKACARTVVFARVLLLDYAALERIFYNEISRLPVSLRRRS